MTETNTDFTKLTVADTFKIEPVKPDAGVKFIEQSKDTNSPIITRFIHTTPASLRIIADRIEQSSKELHFRDKVTFELAHGITLFYDPSLNPGAK